MRNSTFVVRPLACVALLGLMLVGCPHRATPGRPTALQQFLADYHGKVVVLLMGTEGCPGTAKATADMDAYSAGKPANVELVRVDVAPPGQKPVASEPWNHSFKRIEDRGSGLPKELEFFFYPTTYVFDRDGDLRFVGSYEPAQIQQMVNEILAEVPSSPKKIYTPPMAEVGKKAPAFTSATLSGAPTGLDKLSGRAGTVLVFIRTTCPFCMDALPEMKALALRYQNDGIALAIISSSVAKGTGPEIPSDLAPAAVVWDEDGHVAKAYGAEMVPYYFLLNPSGAVVSRHAFTDASASAALNTLLGRPAPTPAAKPGGG